MANLKRAVIEIDFDITARLKQEESDFQVATDER